MAVSAIKKIAQENSRPDVIATTLLIADAVSAALNNTPLAVASNAVGLIKSLYDAGSAEVLPNWRFIANGHEDIPSPATLQFMKREGFASVGTSVLNLAGTIGSIATQVNVAGIATSGSAVTTSMLHVQQIYLISKKGRFAGSQTVQSWCDLLMKMKSLRAGVNTASLVGNSVPVAGVSCAAGLLAGIAATGIKLYYSTACYATATEIHFRAFQEQVISGANKKTGNAKIGPATELFWEIFTRRGVSRFFGQDAIAQMAREPAGWLALATKLTQM